MIHIYIFKRTYYIHTCSYSLVGQSQYYAVLLLPLSLLFIFYALSTYLWRSEKIRTRDNNRYLSTTHYDLTYISEVLQFNRRTHFRWDDPYGPVILTVLLILALTIQFVFKVPLFVYWSLNSI